MFYFDLLDPLVLNCFHSRNADGGPLTCCACHRLILSANGRTEQFGRGKRYDRSSHGLCFCVVFWWPAELGSILLITGSSDDTVRGWGNLVRHSKFLWKLLYRRLSHVCQSVCPSVLPASACLSVCLNTKSSLAASFEMICLIWISRFGCCFRCTSW